MDKYEYKLKNEQIKKLVARKDFYTAMQIADTMDFRREKDVKTLSSIAEVYAENGKYDEAIDLLLQAYDYAPIGKRIVYRLTEFALMAGNLEDAEEYYKEFVSAAPNDQGQYILRYRIDRANGKPVSSLIKLLEEYKELDFDERWSYELATLYDEAGRGRECVALCDEIILWFSLGKYVEKAMELKMKYEPLTEVQREKMENKAKYEAKLHEVEMEYGSYTEEEPAAEPPLVTEPDRSKGAGMPERFAPDTEEIPEGEESISLSDDFGEPAGITGEHVVDGNRTDGDRTDDDRTDVDEENGDVKADSEEDNSGEYGEASEAETASENGSETGAENAANPEDDFAEELFDDDIDDDGIDDNGIGDKVNGEMKENEPEEGEQPEAVQKSGGYDIDTYMAVENLRCTEEISEDVVEVTVGVPVTGIRVVPDQEALLSDRVQRKTKVLMGADEGLDVLTEELIWGITDYPADLEEEQLTPIEEMLLQMEEEEKERQRIAEEEARKIEEIEEQLQRERAEQIRICQEKMEAERILKEEQNRQKALEASLEEYRKEEEKQFEQFAPEDQLWAIVSTDDMLNTDKMLAIAELVEGTLMMGELDMLLKRVKAIYRKDGNETPFEAENGSNRMPFGDDEEAKANLISRMESGELIMESGDGEDGYDEPEAEELDIEEDVEAAEDTKFAEFADEELAEEELAEEVPEDVAEQEYMEELRALDGFGKASMEESGFTEDDGEAFDEYDDAEEAEEDSNAGAVIAAAGVLGAAGAAAAFAVSEAEEVAEAEESVEAGESVEVETAVETEENVEAGEAVEAEESVEAGEAVEAEENVEAGEAVEAGENVEAGEAVEAEESAEAEEAAETKETEESEEVTETGESTEPEETAVTEENENIGTEIISFASLAEAKKEEKDEDSWLKQLASSMDVSEEDVLAAGNDRNIERMKAEASEKPAENEESAADEEPEATEEAAENVETAEPEANEETEATEEAVENGEADNASNIYEAEIKEAIRKERAEEQIAAIREAVEANRVGIIDETDINDANETYDIEIPENAEDEYFDRRIKNGEDGRGAFATEADGSEFAADAVPEGAKNEPIPFPKAEEAMAVAEPAADEAPAAQPEEAVKEEPAKEEPKKPVDGGVTAGIEAAVAAIVAEESAVAQKSLQNEEDKDRIVITRDPEAKDDEEDEDEADEKNGEEYTNAMDYERDHVSVPGQYINVFVKSDKPEAGYRYALEYLKKLPATQRPATVSKTSGAKLSSRGISKSAEKLMDRVIIIEQASQLSQEALEEMFKFLNDQGTTSLVVLIDSQLAIDKIKRKHPMLAEMFKKELVYVDMSADELVQHAKIYAAEQDCVIDEMGTLALYATIEHILQTTDGSLLSEVDEIIDIAIEDAEKLSVGNIFQGVFGSKYNKEGQLILKEKHFNKIKKELEEEE